MESSALTSLRVNTNDLMAKNVEKNIKEEVEVKSEPYECAVCTNRSNDTVDIYTVNTSCGTLLPHFLAKYIDKDRISGSSKLICKGCYELIDVLEQAEIEYFKLKESFEVIISKNPLFEGCVVSASATAALQAAGGASAVKCETVDVYDDAQKGDSDDEPLVLTKNKRQKIDTRKKNNAKHKTQAKNKSRCDSVLDVNNEPNTGLTDIKNEDSQDGSVSSHGAEESAFNLAFEVDDDESATFCPDDVKGQKKKTRKARRTKKNARIERKSKEVLQCDQCDAKYTSIRRFEAHMEKHSDGKPPYICEVCGAHYKHKRACDIHVALHKGISDWKCEECNKLFPSKGALQRHNNIHTGKLNYQCDLCGKSFIHTSSFKMHKLSHSGVKPHSCDVCGLALMTRSHLKRHKRIHSGEKRHECAVCGKRFSERYNMLAHAKMHETAGEVHPQVAKEPRRRLFRCNFCIDRFERRYMLERHMAAVHGRALERAPATPRNTMSKLLKAQAQARDGATATIAQQQQQATSREDDDTKNSRSPEIRSAATNTATAVLAHKLQLSSSALAASSWSSAYAAEFGLRHDFPH